MESKGKRENRGKELEKTPEVTEANSEIQGIEEELPSRCETLDTQGSGAGRETDEINDDSPPSQRTEQTKSYINPKAGTTNETSRERQLFVHILSKGTPPKNKANINRALCSRWNIKIH